MAKKIAAKAENLGNLGKRVEREATRYSPALLGKIPNSELAQEMAGTKDKKSKEYKAAMRNLQRYKKGDRKPPEKVKKKIEKTVKKIIKAKPEKKQKLIPGGRVTASGVICYSADCRTRSMFVDMAPSAMSAFLTATKAGREAGEDFFFAMYMKQQENPGMSMRSGRMSIAFD